jgi:hypothetical protein
MQYHWSMELNPGYLPSEGCRLLLYPQAKGVETFYNIDGQANYTKYIVLTSMSLSNARSGYDYRKDLTLRIDVHNCFSTNRHDYNPNRHP